MRTRSILCTLFVLAILAFLPADLIHHMADEGCSEGPHSDHLCLVCAAFHQALGAGDAHGPSLAAVLVSTVSDPSDPTLTFRAPTLPRPPARSPPSAR